MKCKLALWQQCSLEHTMDTMEIGTRPDDSMTHVLRRCHSNATTRRSQGWMWIHQHSWKCISSWHEMDACRALKWMVSWSCGTDFKDLMCRRSLFMDIIIPLTEIWLHGQVLDVLKEHLVIFKSEVSIWYVLGRFNIDVMHCRYGHKFSSGQDLEFVHYRATSGGNFTRTLTTWGWCHPIGWSWWLAWRGHWITCTWVMLRF